MSPLRNKKARAADVPIIGAGFPDYPIQLPEKAFFLIRGSSARHRWTHFLRQTTEYSVFRYGAQGAPHRERADSSSNPACSSRMRRTQLAGRPHCLLQADDGEMDDGRCKDPEMLLAHGI